MRHIIFQSEEKDEALSGKPIKVKFAIQKYLYFGIMLIVFIVVIGLLVSKNNRLNNQLESTNEELSIIKETLKKSSNNAEKDEHETQPIITSSTIEEQLSSLSELVTQEYTYRNADRRESSETWIFGWTRPFSSKSILITYDGTIKAGIDFSKIEIDVAEETKTITITIPESTITDNYIPQDSIEI